MTRGLTLTYTGSLVAEECIECGITFAIPEDFKAYLLRKGPKKTFYCPNGHPQVYSESVEDNLRKAQRTVTRLRAENDQLAAENRQLGDDVLDKTKEVTRMKRRAKAGLCQFCQRHFVNVARHVENRHPDGKASPSGRKAT